MSNDHNISPAELERRLKEKKWEQVQIKGLAAWLNSYLNKASIPPIEKLPDDLNDGVKLFHFIDLFVKEQNEKLEAAGKKLWDPVPRWIEVPKSRIQKIENAAKALRYITDTLSVKLVGIGAEDIVDGNLMLVLGLLWSSFRVLSLGRLSGQGDREPGASKPEDDLLKWMASMTEGYGVDVTNWKQSFNDGRAWAALIDRFDPEYIDYQALETSGKEATLNLVFEIAEKKLGIPRLLETADLLEGNADERSVILYSSLFHHAWTTNEARIKLANEKRGLGTKMIDIKSKLALEEEERQKAQVERDALRDESEKREKELDEEEARIKEIRAMIAALDAEKERLRKLLEEGMVSHDNQVKDQIKNLGKQKDDLGERLRKETSSIEGLTKQNVELLNQNLELAQHLRKAFGVRPDPFGKIDTSSDLWGTAQGNMSSLSGALREHVNAMHLMLKDMQDKASDPTEQASLNADRVAVVNYMEKVCDDVADKKSGTEITDSLAKLFTKKNNTMLEILKVQDAMNETRESSEMHAYLAAQLEGKRWKKKWFVLRGFILSYYNKKEDQDDSSLLEGEISLATTTASALELPSETKTQWAIKFSMFEDERSSRSELVVGMKTKEERDEWLFAVRGKILYLQYLEVCNRHNFRPDLRFASIFSNRVFSAVQLEKVQLAAPVIEVLCGALEDHGETKTISLISCELDDEGIALFAKRLELLSGLETLDLSRNRITSRGAKSLANAMSKHTGLESLNLSHNKIDDEGLASLNGVLAKNKDLSNLDLSHNYIKGHKHMDEFVAALTGLAHLSSLLFRHNSLGDEAAASLAGLLSTHPGITFAQLSKNQIGDAGTEHLCKALHHNQTLKKLDLANNKVGKQGAAAVKALLLANRVLESVLLADNNLVGGAHNAGIGGASDLSAPGLVVMCI